MYNDNVPNLSLIEPVYVPNVVNLLSTDVVYVCKLSNLVLILPLNDCNATTEDVNNAIDAVINDAELYKLAVALFKLPTEDDRLAVVELILEILISTLADLSCKFVNLLSTDVENAEKSVEPDNTPSPPANNILDSEPLAPAIHLSVVEFHNNEPDDNVPVASFV